MSGPDSYRIGEAAKTLGVRVETLRRWERDGKLHVDRTVGGQRTVPAAEVARVLAERPERRTIAAASARNRFPGVITEVKRTASRRPWRSRPARTGSWRSSPAKPPTAGP